MALWQAEGRRHVAGDPQPAGQTPASITSSRGPSGRNFAYFRAGSAASRMGPGDIPEDYVTAARALHVSGISQAISASACDAVFHAMEIARKSRRHGVLRFQPAPQAVAAGAGRGQSSTRPCPAATFRSPSIDDSEQLTGLTDPGRGGRFLPRARRRARRAKARRADGSMVATAERREHVPPSTCEPVDATGAGDTFAGAFLAEYLAHGDPVRAARYANARRRPDHRRHGRRRPDPEPRSRRGLPRPLDRVALPSRRSAPIEPLRSALDWGSLRAGDTTVRLAGDAFLS